MPAARSNSSGEDRSPSLHGLRLTEPGDHPVDVPITCVITRFGLRSPLYLLPTYLDNPCRQPLVFSRDGA